MEESTDDRYILKRIGKNEADFTVNEAALLKDIKHPGLPEFEPEIETEDGIYILRKFIDGVPLDEYLNDNFRLINTQLALNTVINLCGILTFLHTRPAPIIHRDISPSNIILDPVGGGVYLIDFGIAREYKEGAETDTTFGGKMDFIAPEQFVNKQTDCRADIFSLGMVLACWLNGARDKSMERIIAKSTAIDPQNRYQSARSFSNALKRYKFKVKRKAVMAAAAVLAACVLMAAGFVAGRYTEVLRAGGQNGGYVTFNEPLIEKAARSALGLEDGRPLSITDISKVTGLYIYGEQVAPTYEVFVDLTNNYKRANNFQSPPLGNIQSLEDLRMFTSLTGLFIASHPFSDVTPLQSCKRLRTVEIYDSEVSDVSALRALPQLTALTITNAPVSNFSQFEKLGRLDKLMIDGTSLAGFTELGDVAHVKFLSVTGTLVKNLEGIAAARGVTGINIGHTNITDFSALAELPYLEELLISADMERYLDTFNNENARVSVY